jgi:hypothetical protein
MVGSVSVTSLANRALLAVGGQSLIGNLTTNDDPASVAINTLWAPTFQQLARAAWWNCLRAQTTLTLLKAAQGTPENPQGTTLPIPPVPWLYEYQLPSNCIHARYIVPTLPPGVVGAPPLTTGQINAPLFTGGAAYQIPFQVAYDTDANGNPLTVILTNQTQAQLVYTVDAENPSIWDSQFQAAFVAALAAFLVPALTLHMPLMQIQIQITERIVGEARAADGNEGTTTQNRTADWIAARSGTSPNVYSGALYPAYFAIAWPG